MSRELQQTISPVDGSVCAEFALASAGDIDAALDKAVHAQRAWKATSIDERGVICRRGVDRMVARADQLATELSWQMVRPVVHCRLEIPSGFGERGTYMIGIATGA